MGSQQNQDSENIGNENTNELPDGSSPEHILIVNWNGDAERNRTSQVLQNYDDEMVVRPQGTVRLLHQDLNTEDLTNDLLVKLPSNNVNLFEIDKVDIASPSITTDDLEYEFDEPAENLTNLLNFIITNHKGRMISPSERRYEITSRKGRVEVWYEAGINNQSVTINFEGHPKPIEHLKESFQESLEQAG